MRVPLPWLGEYVGLPAGVTGEQVAADLVRVGLEEEAIHGAAVSGPLVVGQVLTIAEEPQRNGKTIRWCSVDVGAHGPQDGAGGHGPRWLVCGARNFVVGDKVVVSLPGTVLPGGFTISARKTYGHLSDGMICSARELGLGDDHSGIIRLVEWGLADAPCGSSAIELLGLGEETVEVNVTPDRGYAFSVRGVAREYAHATGARFTDPALLDVPKPAADGFEVRLADDAPIRGRLGADRYVARVIRGVDAAAPSPRWMQRRLEQAGMRPISLAVDVTNYVMLGLGQPLHAFDLDRLSGAIVVRRARPGEHLVTLDDVDRALDPEDLLITDHDGERVLAMAGVMGGASSEVTGDTRNILLEAAHFDAVTVARTSRRHKLSTEASRRFERGVDTELADAAAELATRLLVEFGGGTVGPATDIDERVPRPPIRMPADLPARVVGVGWTRGEVVATLTEIGCRVSEEDADLIVSAPSWRPDLVAGVDLAEEVARLRGYEHIPSVLPTAPAGRGLTHGQRVRRTVARALAESGLVEVLSVPFVSPSVHDALGLDADDPRRRALRLANPLSDQQPELRTTLLPNLLETLRRNIGRGTTDVALFELGLVTRPASLDAVAARPPVTSRPSAAALDAVLAGVPAQPRHVALVLAGQWEPAGWWGPGRLVDWADAVAAAELVARTVGVHLDVTADDHAPWHPGRCARLEVNGVLVGHAGELHPKVVQALGVPARTCVAELDLDVLTAASGAVREAVPVSTYPVAKEDLALVVDAAVPAGRVGEALRAGAGELLESVRLFDIYTGPQVGAGRKSLAFALRLRAADHTLTAEEISGTRSGAVAEAERRCGAVLRGQ